MSLLIQIMIGFGASLFFCWLIFSHASPAEARIASQDDLIDPKNPYQIGYLVGMTGGTVADTTVICDALKQFELTHGYRPTLRDAPALIGHMHAPR
jgi:hypothetical protein